MKKSWMLFVLILATFCSTSAFAAQLKISMLPIYSPDEILKRITPLATYLTKELDQPVEAVITTNFSQYEDKLKKGEIQIGYENPYIYTLISDTHEVLTMSIKGEGGDKFRGIIITRADSDIQTLDDLRNRKIMVVGRTSAGGYLSQKITLSEVGIDIEKDCQITEAVENKQENVVLAVYMGEVAAGFIRESVLDKASRYVPVEQIRIINKSAWLPNWAFSINKSLPNNVKRSILNALLSLNRDDPIMKSLKINGFRVSVDEEYDPIRQAAGIPIPKR